MNAVSVLFLSWIHKNLIRLTGQLKARVHTEYIQVSNLQEFWEGEYDMSSTSKKGEDAGVFLPLWKVASPLSHVLWSAMCEPGSEQTKPAKFAGCSKNITELFSLER